MIRSRSFAVAIALIVCAALYPSAYAQVAGGTISGTVTDSTQAVVPGVEMIVLNQATAVSRTLVTNDRGFYSAPNLLPGPYEVRASLIGFRTVVEKLELKVGREAVVNVQLQVGEVMDVVEVHGRATAIDLGASTLSATVEEKTIQELPLNGRDWTLLATLEPGVHTVDTQKPPDRGGTGRVNRGLGTQITVSGARPQQNNYRLDGISINDWSGGGPGNTLGMNLGVEAVQEFSVVTSNASGDYGKTSGGVFNAITRSGTNTFHGSAYEFHRNSALDARNFFDGAEKPPFRRHQFGVAVGGPIREDHTFFFFDYEGLRESLSTTELLRVPSRAARVGQLARGRVTVDPKVVPYLNLYPLPNISESGDIGIASLVRQDITDENFFTARVDHKFFQVDSLHGTFMSDNGQTTGPDTHDLQLQANKSRRKLVTLEHTHIFSPSLINIARVGYSRAVGEAPVPLEIINPAAADPALGFLPGRRVGVLEVSGLTRFPGVDRDGSQFFYNSYQAYEDVFYTRQSHALKFGFAFERIQVNQFTSATPSGRFRFGSLRDFLTNRPTTFNALPPGLLTQPTYLRQTVIGAYAQDDWRVRPNLTLNLGLRYEMATVPTEKFDRLATLVNLTDAQPKLGSPYFQNPTFRNFSPRVGFSWDPFKDGKMAVRGGFGIYDTLPLTYLFELLTLVTAPFNTNAIVANPPRGSFPNNAFQLITPEKDRVTFVEQQPKRSYVLQWNFNIQREILADLVAEVGYAGSHGLHQPFRTQDTDIVLPIETPDGLFWPTPGSGTRINENFGQIQALAWNVSTSYNALNLRVTRRLRNGLQIGGSYTWSKSIDSNSATVTGGQFANSITGIPLFWPNLFRGLSDFDVRHNLVLNGLWEIPGPRSDNVLARWLQGWQLGGIFRAASGNPFTLLIGGDSLGQKSNNPFNFPDRVNTPECKNPVNPGNPDRYVKTECFIVPQLNNRLGNAGRNTVIGPGLVNLDLSTHKTIPIRSISETAKVQFRAEIFNILNHANFRPPSGAGSQVFNARFNRNANAGRLTSTTITSRQIQFALKLVW